MNFREILTFFNMFGITISTRTTLSELILEKNVTHINDGKIFGATFWAIAISACRLVEFIVWFPTLFTLVPSIPSVVAFHFECTERTEQTLIR